MEVLSRPSSSSSSLTRPSPTSSSSNHSFYGGATENELLLIAPYMYMYDPAKDDDVIDPDEDENTKFLRQVRQSKGYEVNAFPSLEMGSPFMGLSLNCGFPRQDEAVKRVSDFAITTINKDSGKNYKFVKLVNVVYSRTRVYLLTFEAKDKDKKTDADADRVTSFRAMVFDGLRGIPERMRLMEYKKLLPSGDWELVKVLHTGPSIQEEINKREAELKKLIYGNN